MKSEEVRTSGTAEDSRQRKLWEPMTVTCVGEAADIVQGGGGKMTSTTGDPGEPRKVPSSG